MVSPSLVTLECGWTSYLQYFALEKISCQNREMTVPQTEFWKSKIKLSLEHIEFILLCFVEQNQTMPVEQNHTMPVEQTNVTPAVVRLSQTYS